MGKWRFQKMDGSLVDKAYINGYQFGDRLLEDVMFEVTIGDNNEILVKVDKSSELYFNELNTEKWLREAKEFAQSNDIFEEFPDHSSRDELVIFDPETGKECPNFEEKK